MQQYITLGEVPDVKGVESDSNGLVFFIEH